MLDVVKSFFDGLSPKEKKLVYITGLVLGLMAFDRLVIGPIFYESKMIDERIRDQITHTEKNIRLLAYREKILEEDASYSDYYTREGLSREVLIATFLGEVESIAKSAEISLSNINPVNVVPMEGYTEFSLDLECQGKMKNIIDFMYKIDSSRKPMKIRSFEMAVRNRDNYEVRCGLTVEKMIFTRAEIAVREEPESDEETMFITEKVVLE
ncbi:MAG: type 4a pilus biogenesis protein PilO [Candidatus Omnitrophota bacterium]